MSDKPEIGAVLQAAGRVRRVYACEDQRDVYATRGADPTGTPPYDGDFPDWLAGKHLECDRLRLADFALSILPSGERPEPICSYDATTGTMLWNFDEDGGIYYGVVIERNGEGTGGIHWDNSVGYGDEGYPSESEARLALQWSRFDKLIEATKTA